MLHQAISCKGYLPSTETYTSISEIKFTPNLQFLFDLISNGLVNNFQSCRDIFWVGPVFSTG